MDVGKLIGEIFGGGLATVLAIVIVIFVVAVFVWLTGQELDLGWGDKKLHLFRPTAVQPSPVRAADPAAGDVTKLRAANGLFNDLAQGIVAILEAEGDESSLRAGEWFERFSSSLGHSLTLGVIETYRVTVWLDDPETGKLGALGHHLTTTNELPRLGTVAGHVVQTGEEYYARDCSDDPIYRSLDGRPRSYNCVFGVPLGIADDVWGSITVDAKAVDGFTDNDKEIVRHFAGLASAAGAAWWTERAEQTTPTGVRYSG